MLRALVLVLVGASACKNPQAGVAPTQPAKRPAPVAVEETVDGLTPPPPRRPPDLAIPVRANTLNGDPNGPKQAEFDTVQAQAQAKVQACLDAIPAGTNLPGGVARLAIKFEVQPDGTTKNGSIDGAVPPETLNCAKAALTSTAFPKFSGSPVKNAFTLTYSRPQAQPAPAQ